MIVIDRARPEWKESRDAQRMTLGEPRAQSAAGKQLETLIDVAEVRLVAALFRSEAGSLFSEESYLFGQSWLDAAAQIFPNSRYMTVSEQEQLKSIHRSMSHPLSKPLRKSV